jgi:hypothetical protein
MAFLRHLAEERRVAGATQGQALAVPLFLYRQVLDRVRSPADFLGGGRERWHAVTEPPASRSFPKDPSLPRRLSRA